MAGDWLSGAAIGSLLTAMVGGVPLEDYRRHRDRKSAAAILAAEIEAFLEMAVAFKTVSNIELLLPVFDAGKDVPFPKLYTAPPEFGPLFEKHIDRLGLLPPDVAGRVVRFYHCMIGARAAVKNMFSVDWDDQPHVPKMKASLVRSGIAMWRDAEALGPRLIADLQAIAGEPWYFGRAWRILQGVSERTIPR